MGRCAPGWSREIGRCEAGGRASRLKGVVPASPAGHGARDSPEADAQTLDDVEREVDRGAMCDNRSGSSPETPSPSSFIEPSRLPSPSAPSPIRGGPTATEGGWASHELKAPGPARAAAPQPDSEPEAPHPRARTAAKEKPGRTWDVHCGRPVSVPVSVPGFAHGWLGLSPRSPGASHGQSRRTAPRAAGAHGWLGLKRTRVSSVGCRWIRSTMPSCVRFECCDAHSTAPGLRGLSPSHPLAPCACFGRICVVQKSRIPITPVPCLSLRCL